MNNNKKYKKWTLGLVAPALVLAPIAVVASCSSSTEEKEAYGVTFTNNNEIRATIHKSVQPNALTKDQFKEEVLEHKSDLFTIEGTLPSDSFLNDNIEIGELNPSADTKTVSAKVKLNNANTNGEAIEKTITLKGLGYVEVTLTDLKYTIAFKDQSNPQEIPLTNQESISVGTLTAEKLIDLVLATDNKAKILDITGTDETKITDEVLANQILKATELKPAATEGKITFKLSVEKPENGAGDVLEKTITFIGFKQETDSTPPASPKYKITLKTTTPEKEYQITGIDTQLASATISTGDDVRDLIIKNKDKMFDLKGDVPEEETWWKEKLVITSPTPDDTEGKVTFNLVLDDSNTIDEPTDSDGIKINETDVVIKGFQIKIPETGQETTIKSEISTVTLGLNGGFEEVKKEVTPDWIAEKKGILFQQGTEPISKETISSVQHEEIPGETGKFNLKFTLANYYGANGSLTTTPKEFTIKINGISSNPTKGETLRNKSGTGPLSVGLVDPALAEKTYDDYKNDSANIFTKEFVFKYRKHLLTGDFTKVDQAGKDGFLKVYDDGTFVKITPDDSKQTIQIKFTILGDKLEGTTADTEYTIIFNQFKTF